MNQHFRHPLDTIYNDNSLLLLEAMIPYVDPSLKLPLVLLIKIQELQILTRILQNPARTDACGLNKGSGDPEQMMTVLCQAMGLDLPGQLKQAQSMMSMMNAMNTGKDSMHTESPLHSDIVESATKPESESSAESEPSDFARDDMVNAIRQILSEQEVMTHGSKSIT